MSIISDRTGVRQSLCCECGDLRTVKAGAARRNHVSPGESPERIAELMNFAPDYWSQIKPYHRLLEDLKCTPCGKVTQHAIVAPANGPGDAYRDMAEEENLGPAAAFDGILAEIARDIDHIRSMGILVDYGRAQGGKCMVQRYLEPDEDGPEWRVIVQEGLPVDVLRRVVTWAWRVMLPSYVKDYDKSWNGEVCRDEYGENRGCYYTGD